MSDTVLSMPAGIRWGVTKAPRWNTRVQTAVGGRETRVAFASLPVWRWAVSFEFLRQSVTNQEFQYLAQFFNDRRGRWDSWLYNDPTDNTATDMNFGTGNASTTAFQLNRKLYTSGVLSESVYNLNGAPVIKKNGVTLATPADYSVSASGLVTFTSAPAVAAALTWTGAYYWRVRFDQDIADFDNFMSALWSLGELSFSSILGS